MQELSRLKSFLFYSRQSVAYNINENQLQISTSKSKSNLNNNKDFINFNFTEIFDTDVS